MVYFISAKERKQVKIGFTKTNPLERLNTLSTSSPEELVLLGVIQESAEYDEAKIHEKFKSLKVRREWFDYKEPLKGKDDRTRGEELVDVMLQKVENGDEEAGKWFGCYLRSEEEEMIKYVLDRVRKAGYVIRKNL